MLILSLLKTLEQSFESSFRLGSENSAAQKRHEDASFTK